MLSTDRYEMIWLNDIIEAVRFSVSWYLNELNQKDEQW